VLTAESSLLVLSVELMARSFIEKLSAFSDQRSATFGQGLSDCLWLITEVLQTSSFQFSVGSFQQEKRVFLKTENPKLYTTGLFAKVLL